MIYICCFEGVTTGGTELLHQLAYALNSLGEEAKMVYMRNGYPLQIVEAESTELYKDYCSVSEADMSQIDQFGNIIVVPEVMFDLFGKIENAKKIAWWLSIDNYLEFIKRMYGVLVDDNQDFEELDYYEFAFRNDVKHLVQSYYAKDYLEKKLGISEEYIDYLSDYINDSYLREVDTHTDLVRKDMILYNPAKGWEKIEHFVESTKDEFLWFPLENLSRAEMIERMKEAKVYVDFGNHPGKDRIPREAAICGCCVITGICGAAANDKDINIPMDYKINDVPVVDTAKLKKTIEDVFENYEEKVNDFMEYRNAILNEKHQFMMDVERIFF